MRGKWHMKRIRVFISGKVHGVFFRAETCHHAKNLNLKGWVRNLRDGRVEAVFEGNEDDVNRMIEWCRKGPSIASVTGIETTEEPLSEDFTDFTVRY